MAISTSLISGLSSGIDWSTMVDQLIAIDHKRVDLISNKKSDYETKLKEWQSFNTKLLSLKTAAEGLKDTNNFKVLTSTMSTDSSTVKASDLLSISTSETASSGSYNIKVTNLAQAQKLSSNPFTDHSSALGSSYAGDIVVNGKVVAINATDTLSDVAASINKANTGANPSGVTASVINFGANDYRLILTSNAMGAKGISLLNGSTKNLVQQFGWKDNQTAALKNSITNGAQSDRFTSSTVAIKSLLGLTTGESGDITIGDKTVTINLGAVSLTDIKNAINTAAPTGVTASIISQTENGNTYYRLQIDGTNTLSESTSNKNILNTLGILDHTSTDVAGKVSGNSMTSDGSSITASTLLKDIDGYNTFTAGGNPAGDYITLTGKNTANADVSVNFDITSATTAQNLLDQIKTSYGNVLAYVTADGKIRVDDLSGSGNLQVNLADHIHDTNSKLEFKDLDADFGAAAARQRQVVAGEDATVVVDGVSITKASNTIDDVITGVTMNLLKEDGSTITLNVARDISAIKDKITSFVSAYNDVSSYIKTQSSYDTKTNKTGGVLFGDGTISSVKSDLTSIVTQSVWGVNSQFSIMGLVGINLDKTGQLNINDTTLTGYLQTNFNDIMSLFTAQGITSSSSLSYTGNTQNSKAGEYTIHIDTAASRSTSTSDTAVGGALGSAETMTITEGSKTANISLTGSMTISDIINAINAETDAVYTQTLAGNAQLKTGGVSITSETTWKNIDGATLQNGDVISFSGTSRGGTSVTGSYTISTVATDKVQGLLSAIENAFSNNVTASIDTSGRIVVTDKYSGASQLALDITEPAGKGLDFGTVLTTNTGGQTGRYALAITAANDGSNHLVLTHNSYGSSYSFAVSETNGPSDLLWTGGDQTVNNGTNVAGTIGGETATGSGQVLTGNTGNVNTEGLSVRYTGTATGDAGTLTLTVGTAELFSRSLLNITDSYEGYVSFKQTSLQKSIDDSQTKIDQMEARLTLKKEQMINRFVVMETALSTIKNQSNWLTGQISALTSR